MDPKSETASPKNATKQFFIHLARAFAGALLFSFPLMMTMEMWFLGFYMSGWRLALFTVLTVPLLIGLSFYDGFEPTSSIKDDIIDTFVAYTVGFTTSTILLLIFGVINFQMSANEVIGKISVQAITAGFGAMFAQSLLIGDKKDEQSENRKREASYFGELFLMSVGAVFLSMSVAPTEEMNLIAYQMSGKHTLALIFGTLILMQAFFYTVEFRGHQKNKSVKSFLSIFFRFTAVGYAIALLISFYVLWTFGSVDDMEWTEKLKVIVVLGFPAAVGAAGSRFIL